MQSLNKQIKLLGKASKKTYLVKYKNYLFENPSILELLRKNDFGIASSCDGKGACKKCEIEIYGKGKVLSCQIHLKEILEAENETLINVSYL